VKTRLALVVASAFLIGGAYAQSSDPSASHQPASDPSNHAMATSDAHRNNDVEKHIMELHGKLGITSAEDSQWEAVAQAMRDNANELDQVIDKREPSKTAIDDLNAYADVVQAHADGIKKLSAAFSPLYASMPDSQKRMADEVFVHRIAKHKK
jgi:protein CpxP